MSLEALVQEEVVLEEGCSLDLVVDGRGERLAVEVDGPSHFVGRKATAPQYSNAGSLNTLAGASFRCPTGRGANSSMSLGEGVLAWPPPLLSVRAALARALFVFVRAARRRAAVWKGVGGGFSRWEQPLSFIPFVCRWRSIAACRVAAMSMWESERV